MVHRRVFHVRPSHNRGDNAYRAWPKHRSLPLYEGPAALATTLGDYAQGTNRVKDECCPIFSALTQAKRTTLGDYTAFRHDASTRVLVRVWVELNLFHSAGLKHGLSVSRNPISWAGLSKGKHKRLPIEGTIRSKELHVGMTT